VRTLVGVESLTPPPSGTSVTIGTFDGVHLGHRSLIARAAAHAHELGAESAVVTWDRHPSVVLRPDRVPPLLTSPERKVELLEETGMDTVAVLPFTKEFSQWPPERFVDDVLVNGLGARFVSVGKSWRFGHKAKGNVALLTELGRAHGFEVEEVELAENAGGVVSSSRLRRAVMDGNLANATEMLGRPFDVDGTVVHGDDRGAGLGFPTANMELEPGLAYPPRGVYACRASILPEQDVLLKAAVNVGVNPTFGGQPGATPMRIEAYLLDFEGDLYGKRLRVQFVKRLRDEIAFPSPHDLIAQIKEDVAATRAVLS
jgi:riboflavin kinase / FMN adenylyltransferase